MNIPNYEGLLPYITTDKMREVDQMMVDEYKISLIQMMENAGRNLGELARVRFFDGVATKKRTLVLAGNGGNGGGGLVCARHLKNWGAEVTILLATEKDKLKEVTRHQLHILEKMNVSIEIAEVGNSLISFSDFDLIIDSLIGYSLESNPKDILASLITNANECGVSVLALDTPSGLNTTSGEIYSPTMQAKTTMTLALPKTGFKNKKTHKLIGDLYLADISVPVSLYENLKLKPAVPSDLFAQSTLVHIAYTSLEDT